jgi:type II restriction enzyme
MVVGMVNYEMLGYPSLKSFQDDFYNSLLKTICSYDYFVDWKKAEENARKYLIEWGLLNCLTLEKDRNAKKELLRRVLKEHPKILECVPLLLAVRENRIEVMELAEQVLYREFRFYSNLSQTQIEDGILFFEKTGLLDLFEKIKDVYTYALGVEVGLDSNARKNRSGSAFCGMIEFLLSKNMKELNQAGYNFEYEKEIKMQDILPNIDFEKKVDFLIKSKGKPIAACEANIYHSSGSKPSEVSRAYVKLNDELNKEGIRFIWFTDGRGWLDMKKPFNEASERIEIVMNYTQSTKMLKKLLTKIII